ncbi:hypothetical protein LV84_01617 [Algoriphagus ratkowskyi]|uniref:Uncharacterized protein n=1 Tax=Algoriphagus ratkowskyi TaxID=57028 RepID=A0A2W7RUU4_9BACT|nr:hypothetical protein [Algoriphagus ratkowskyi]PZX58409.1 hypothetical protein LV84_01617 [Algoriphagus ratkowskyi]TXD77724.1 hypothetical protein ESW18_10140 [Algoriphagus ratkowskyi]
MKFPSVFRTAAPMRFDIKPRYYDPVREEIEQRTSQIKKDLEAQGLLERSDGSSQDIGSYGAGIRGSFSQHKGIKERDGENMFASTAMIRTFIFLLLLGSIFGYVYLGPVIFEYIAYVAALIGAIYFFFRLKPKKKNE